MPNTATVTDLESQVRSFIADAKTKARGGLTVAEFVDLAEQLLKLVVAGLEQIQAPGADKKSWAVNAVGLLFDAVASSLVPVWLLPVWPLIRGSVRQIVTTAAGVVIDRLTLPLVRAAA
ncbi:MAG: hypothetical protein EBZ59_08935 [Planctomycetia bacterium]|nr:hypothetical protein [Planctomycetia bacterium]